MLKDDFSDFYFSDGEMEHIDNGGNGESSPYPTAVKARAALNRANVDLDWVELCRVSGVASSELARLGVNATRRKSQAERVLEKLGFGIEEQQ